MDRGAWRSTVHGSHKESDTDVTEWLNSKTQQLLLMNIRMMIQIHVSLI